VQRRHMLVDVTWWARAPSSEREDAATSAAPTRSASHPYQLDSLDTEQEDAASKGVSLLKQVSDHVSRAASSNSPPRCCARRLLHADGGRAGLAREQEDLRVAFGILTQIGVAHPLGSASAHLSWGQFQAAFGRSENAPVIKRMFDLLDRDGSGSLCQETFVEGLSPLCTRASAVEKLRFLFDCCDLDGSGGVSAADLTVALCASVATLNLPTATLQHVVERTFSDMHCDMEGEILWPAFLEYSLRHPEQSERMAWMLGVISPTLVADMWLSQADRWLESGTGESRVIVVVEQGSSVVPC